MLFSCLIIQKVRSLQCLLNNFLIQYNYLIFSKGLNARFQSIKCCTCVSIGHLSQIRNGFLVYLNLFCPQSVNVIHQRTFNKFFDILGFKSIEHKNATTRKQSGIDFKTLIFCRGSNENNGSILYMWQKGILLEFIKSMNFINKKNSSFLFKLLTLNSLCHKTTYIFDPLLHRTKFHKIETSKLSDHMSKRCFSCSWWSPKNHRRNLILKN